MAYVLPMPALELRDPVAFFVEVVAHDSARYQRDELVSGTIRRTDTRAPVNL